MSRPGKGLNMVGLEISSNGGSREGLTILMKGPPTQIEIQAIKPYIRTPVGYILTGGGGSVVSDSL